MGAKSASPASSQILSEIGLVDLPDEWTVVRLEDLLSNDRGISVGVMYPGDHAPDGIPLIKAGDISGSRINPNPEFRITPEKHFEYRRTELAGGELLISLVGDVGRCALVPPTMAGWNAARAIAVLRFQSQAYAGFVRACLMSPPFQHLMRAWSTTTVQATLNLKEVRQIPLPWPPAEEQRAIAHILGTLDDKIELNRRRNQTLEAMARALFKDWFVDFGPVRANRTGTACRALTPAPHLPADLWRLFPDRLDDEGKPEGWSERPLDEIADFLNGLALQKFPATDPDDSLPVIKIAELRNGVSAKSDRASREVPAKYVIKDGDFLFSWSGSLLAKFWTEGEGALNQHLFKVTSERYPMWFVSHWVHHHLEEFQAIAASKATTMGHIQRGHLKAAMTICPPDNVVGRMGIVMAPLVEQSIYNELEARTLADLRNTLLPKLISGELRIADAEKFLRAAA